jgi:predicted metal-dependent peptidase
VDHDDRIHRIEEREGTPELSAALREKLSRAKAKLLIEHPYFGTLAGRLEVSLSHDIDGFLSDGTRFECNDDYIESLSLDELGFALANGAMHAALAHDDRRSGRMGWLWQLATDYAINDLLVENGLERPDRTHYDPRFSGMYAEEIYARLKDEIQNEEFDDDASNDTGYNENNKRHQKQMQNAEGDHDTQEHRPQMEVESVAEAEQFERLAREALEKMERMGEVPGGIERFFAPGGEPKIDWRQELHHILDRYYRDDYRMMPPSKKLLYMGTYLASLDSEHFSAVIAVDSSGSVDEVLLGTFIAEIESLMLEFPRYRLDLLVCDAKIQSHRTFEGGEPLEVELQGGGGTDFRPVFEYVEAELDDTNLLLYFTDGAGQFPDVEPLFETVWVTPEQTEVPFGRVLPMKG